MVKYGRRLISLLLVLVMFLSIVPINALADDYKFKVTVFGTLKVYLYNDFNDAWDKVTDKGGTIEVRADVTLGGMKEVPKDIEVTLIATGKTIDRGLSETNSKNSGEHFVIRKNGSLTIQGGTITGGNNKNGGGAIHVQENGSLVLEGVTVTKNYTTDNYGGAIRLQGKNSTLTMDSTTVISDNHALFSEEQDVEFWGGGAICVAGESCTITGDGTKITGNTSFYHGGGISVAGTNCLINGLIIENNRCDDLGGGIFIREESPNATITNCEIKNNTAYMGGGIFLDSADGKLSDSLITGNTATDLGGGVYIDGGDTLDLSGKLSVFGNTGGGSTEDWDDNLFLDEYKEWYELGGWHNYYYGRILNEPDGPYVEGGKVHIGFDPANYECSKENDGTMFQLSGEGGVYYCDHFVVDLPGWTTFWASGKSKDNSINHISRTLMATSDPNLIPLQPSFAEVEVDSRYRELDETYENTGCPIQEGIFSYRGSSGEDLDAVYYYSDGYFAEDPKAYNTHLATMSLAMSMAATNPRDNNVPALEDGMDEYQNKARNIYQLLSDIGFQSNDIFISDSFAEKPTNNSIGAALAAKELPLTNEDGKPYILLAIAIRGAGYDAEWAGNVSLGGEMGTEAQGFDTAATKVEEYLMEFLNSNTSMDLWRAIFDGRVKFWVTGFSRGGATANLLAKRLVETYTIFSDNIPGMREPWDNQVYAYTFAAPRAGVNEACVMEGTGEIITYPTIHNVINGTDLVAYFYPWQMGFTRYGADHYMPGSPAGEMEEITNTFIYEEWEVAFAWEDKTTIDYRAYQDNVTYDTDSEEYKERVGMMVQHLASLNPEIRFNDYFRFANVEYVDNAFNDGALLQQCDTSLKWYSTAQDWFEFFAQHFLEWTLSKNYVDDEIIADYQHNFRDYYANEKNFLGENYTFVTVEAALCTLLPHVIPLMRNEEFVEAMSYRLSSLSKSDKYRLYYDGIIFAYECDEHEMRNLMNMVCGIFTDSMTREVYSEELGAYIQESVPGLDDFIPSLHYSDIYRALRTLTYAGLRFVNEDWWWDYWDDPNTHQKYTYLPGANGSQLHLGTLLYNMDRLFMNHYPEVYMAWLRTDDSYYTDASSGVNLDAVIEYDLVNPTVQDVSFVDVFVNYEKADVENTYSGRLTVSLSMNDGGTVQDENKNQGSMIYYKLHTDSQSSDTWQLYQGPFSVTDYETTKLTIEYKIMRYGLSSEIGTITLKMAPLAKYPFHITDNIFWDNRAYEAIGDHLFTVTSSKDYKIWKWGVRYDPDEPFVDMDPQPSNLKQFEVVAPCHYVQYVTYYYLPVDYVNIADIKPVAGEPLGNAMPTLYYRNSGLAKMSNDAVEVETIWYDMDDVHTPISAETIAEEGKEYFVRVFIRCNQEASNDLFDFVSTCAVSVTGATEIYKKVSEDRNEIDIQCNFNPAADPVYSDVTVATYDLNLQGPTTTPGQLPEELALNYAEGDLVSIPAPAFENMQFAQWVVSTNVSDLNQELDLTQSTLTFTMPDSAVTVTAQYIPIVRRIDVEIPALVVGEALPEAITSVSVTIGNTYKLNPACIKISWSDPTVSIVEEGVIYAGYVWYNPRGLELEDGTPISGNIVTTDSTQVYINGKPTTLQTFMGYPSAFWYTSADTESTIISEIYTPDNIVIKRDENGKLPETVVFPETVRVVSDNALLTSLPVTWYYEDQEYSSSSMDQQFLRAFGTVHIPDNIQLIDGLYDADKQTDGLQVSLYVNAEASKYSAMPTAEVAVADDGTVTVSLLSTKSSAKIYYTTDGTEPTESSTLYAEPFTIEFVDGYSTVKAIAAFPNRLPSEVATFTYTNLEPENAKLVDRWNLVLMDDLLVNFYLNMAEDDTVRISVAGEETLLSAGDMEQTEDGKYIAPVRLAAAQMTEDITFYLEGSKDAPVSYTVREYAHILLEDEAYSQYHPLVKEMLNYGAQAQTYFDYRAGSLANAEITGVAATDIPTTTEDVVLQNNCAGILLYGASMLCRDNLAVRFYLSGDITGCTITVGGVEYTPVAKENMHYVEVAGILPQDLDQQLTLTVTDANGDTLTFTYGPMNYIVRMNQKGTENLKNLLKALYNYHLAAKDLNA